MTTTSAENANQSGASGAMKPGSEPVSQVMWEDGIRTLLITAKRGADAARNMAEEQVVCQLLTTAVLAVREKRVVG